METIWKYTPLTDKGQFRILELRYMCTVQIILPTIIGKVYPDNLSLYYGPFKVVMEPFVSNYLVVTLETSCTGTSRVSCKFYLVILEKIPSALTTIIFGIINGNINIPKDHRSTYSDVISFITISNNIP